MKLYKAGGQDFLGARLGRLGLVFHLDPDFMSHLIKAPFRLGCFLLLLLALGSCGTITGVLLR